MNDFIALPSCFSCIHAYMPGIHRDFWLDALQPATSSASAPYHCDAIPNLLPALC
ncbi:MAG: hypothetical protein M0Z50_05680 [Planctomycetia bacterium]|nr:hypothetical protein [Planctomycetia bacterium]